MTNFKIRGQRTKLFLLTSVSACVSIACPASRAAAASVSGAVQQSDQNRLHEEPNAALTETSNQAPAQSGPSDSPQQAQIVITGSKYGTNLQRAPVSASVLDSKVLEKAHVQNLSDVQVRVPDVTYSQPASFAEIYIRGVGSNFSLAGLESAVATYVDGVYLQRQAGAVLDAVDLESIQVLRGPQGTLYGRNATGGAVLVNTANPARELGGYASLDVGSFWRIRADAVANVPLSSTLAFRVAASRLTDDGYIHDLVNGGRVGKVSGKLIRAKLLWQPTSSFRALYTFEYSTRSEETNAKHQILSAPLCMACAIYGYTPPQDSFWSTTAGRPLPNSIKYAANTLDLSWNPGNISIRSVTGLRFENVAGANEQDATPAPFFYSNPVREKGPTFTEDLYGRTHFRGPLNFLLGVSYEHDRTDLDTYLWGDLFAGVAPVFGRNLVKLTSFSAYGEAYYDFTPGLRLTVGGRYNVDRKSVVATNGPTAVLVFQTTGWSDHKTFKDFTPRAVLSYERGAGYYYLSYNRGAKSGGYATPSFTPISPLQSEHLDSFEVGAKNRFFGDQLRTSLAAFYGLYNNMQVQQVTAIGIGAANAAKAKIYGAEAEIQWTPVERLNLSVGAAYLHARFTNYKNAAVFVVPSSPALGLANGVEDLSGTPLPHAPPFSGYAAADYSAVLGSGWMINPSMQARYSDKYYFLAGAGGPLQLDRQRRYLRVDAFLMFRNGQYELGPYVTNLTNAKYYDDVATGNYGAAYVAAAPRRYGVRARVTF